ncbi:endo alpha-1,4 polygalactosaminidase [Streptomyces agglomeratus]|uniref:Endo alpha-1,4 polygalactosaminidase n=1 Tax=Streptomyces agglomeratus TaxID=285458 RepID=A0A1E5PFJ2_9ACTN|nr:endo alpha-1,4 polygalactosaminidase [Streptomyces agglomeratus]OEJ28318.1 endo alpha-1,4 polygalactosaminidase [Streptomyces agglomeratus]OEJ37617.1 endo alpha-1,4 polygalactosaminidase [Streptomyces agglomeratus]OEJ47996.1 endo alpha-1,4 polygalactosaminidase [Streptomyces agglomeratus]OEJ50156.1 endo alpha-1,4 polygalactosaminidase [Streptomyces agglomeratus]OEJ57485.1 endo alpha-1,4 polygalactosaminidase [Streptomyces agglomeratus]
MTRSRPLCLLFLLALLAACSAPAPEPAPDPRPPHSGRWRPAVGTAWQWQLEGRVDRRVDVPVYDIDGFENDAAAVRRLHRDGRKVICYINAGAWESFRPDRRDFPAAVLGRGNGWAGERWLDIRRLDVLRPLMAKRFDMCREKGFDAVEPDLMDGYLNDTGFPLTAGHQLAYNRMLAGLAHARGMSVGLKNDLPQIPRLVADFDFAVNEECVQYDDCAALAPFVKAGKAVLHVEYAVPVGDFCERSRKLGLSSMRKRLDLGVWRQPC